MAWTLKDLRELIKETADRDENEIIYINDGLYVTPLCDGDLIFENDLLEEEDN